MGPCHISKFASVYIPQSDELLLPNCQPVPESIISPHIVLPYAPCGHHLHRFTGPAMNARPLLAAFVIRFSIQNRSIQPSLFWTCAGTRASGPLFSLHTCIGSIYLSLPCSLSKQQPEIMNSRYGRVIEGGWKLFCNRSTCFLQNFIFTFPFSSHTTTAMLIFPTISFTYSLSSSRDPIISRCFFMHASWD